MPHYFLVAFGHGVTVSPVVPASEAGDEMRGLVDRAIAALGWTGPEDFTASVAPNGLMLAFPDQSPDRALRLAEAVQGQLQHAARRGRALIPISCVITSGPMRRVDVLGCSSNFEGRPAIAAARILARSRRGDTAVDESAWGFPALDRDLGEAEEVPGKHPGETFRIKLHKKVRFPLPAGLAPRTSEPGKEIRFRITSAGKDGWRVAPARGAERLVDAPWKMDAAFGRALNEFFAATGGPVAHGRERDALLGHAARVGDGLARSLLTEEDVRAIRGARPAEGQPPVVVIESEDDLILALPWELVRIGGDFAVREAMIDLVRTIPISTRAPVLAPPDRYLKLLVLVAAPEGSRLNYEAESYRITRALHDHSEVVHADLGTADDLVQGIVTGQPIGVHFSGHGLPGALAFENDEGGEEVVRVADILQRIKAKAPERIPRFFYLASCHGNTPPRVDAGESGSPSSAARLHREGVTQVVGYFGPIADELSTRAEVALYTALSEGRTTRHAVRQARLALVEPYLDAAAGHRSAVERGPREGAFPFAWAQLVLYHRGPDHPVSLPLPVKYVEECEAQLERTFQPGERRILATGFIGRRRELHRVRGALGQGQRAFVLQGLGGLGKTTLAFRILPLLARGGHTLAIWCGEIEKEEHQARALVNRLSSFGQELYAERWAAVAQLVDREAGADEPRRFGLVLQAILQNTRHLLLYLDNLESLLAGPDDEDPQAFGAWRSSELEQVWRTLEEKVGPRLSVVASCRYRNPSFVRHVIPVPEMGSHAIFRMLAWFAGLRRLSSASRARLVEKLHGHPRAVEFLDALISPALADWEDHRGPWSAPSTEAGIETEWRELVEPALPEVEGRLRQDLLFDRIWDRILDERARRMLYRMTLLRRAWDWEVMQRLGEPEEAPSAAAETAERLRKASLVGQVEEKDIEGRWVTRFQLHPTTARFTRDRFGARDGALETRTYLRVGEYLEALARSSPDIRVDLDAGHYLFLAREFDRAFGLLGGASELLQRWGRVREGLAVLQPFLAPDVTSRLDRGLLGRALGTMATACSCLAEIPRAIEHYQRAAAIFREIGDRQGEGAALGNLGSAYAVLGQVEKAIEHYQQGLAISREIGDRQGEVAALGNLGNACALLGQVEKAIEHYQPGLVISREIGDRRGEGGTLSNLGLAYAWLGQADKAVEHNQQALVIHREIGDRRGEGVDLGNLGLAYADLGQVEKAIEHHQQALVISREIGDRRFEDNHLGNLGTAYVRLGQVENAIEHYRQALAISREIGNRQGEGNHLGNLGTAYVRLGQVENAIEHCQQALAIRRQIGDRQGEGNDLGNLGTAYAALGQMEKAIEHYQQALAIRRQIGARRGEGADLGNLGNAYAGLGQVEKAIVYLEQARTIAREIKDPVMEATVARQLRTLRGEGPGQ